jgi:hypothetical protein
MNEQLFNFLKGAETSFVDKGDGSNNLFLCFLLQLYPQQPSKVLPFDFKSPCAAI